MNSKLVTPTLPKPQVLSYNQAGIGDIDIADPSHKIEVLIGPIEISEKDRVDLYWGSSNDPVSTYVHSPDAPATNGLFSLYVDTRHIQSGVTDVYYTSTPFPGSTPKNSETLSITVKLAIPGGRDPDPASPYQNEKINAPIVFPMGAITEPNNVISEIAPYENMSTGDRISLYWNGIKVEVPALNHHQVGKPVKIPVSKDVVLKAGDSNSILVRYDIRDVVNNWSRFSLPTYVEVEAGNATLLALVVPQAANLELDLTLLAGADIQALVVSYPDIQATDQITMTVERSTAEGMDLGPYFNTKSVGTSIGFVEFKIPNEQFEPIAQGRARLKYNVKKASGDELRSKSLSLTIVGENQVLEAPKLPVAEQNNGVLDPAAHNVLAYVPAYYFMADGNDVKLVWMGKTASGANVIHEELKNLNSDDVGESLAFLIPDEKVSALAGGALEMYYTVTTFAKAYFRSPSLHVQVSANSDVNLPAATVDGVGADGLLDPQSIVLEAIVRIQPFAGMAPLDVVTLQWDGRATGGSYTASTTLNSGTSGKEVVFRVKKSYVDANLKGNVDVSYSVQRGNRTLSSEMLLVKVGATGLEHLPKPTVAGLDASNTLIPENVPDTGVVVTVPRYDGIDHQDSIIVKWEGREHYVTEPMFPHHVGDIQFTVPKAIAVGSAGEDVKVKYAVTRDSAAPVESSSTDFRVQPLASPLSIGGGHALLLNGYVVFEGRPPANPPANAVFTQPAKGGKKPYVYTSSNVNVAWVDQAGKVKAAGNGATTITVTDALGAKASYQLKTSGARVFVGFKNERRDFHGYQNFCAQQGVNSMNANDFKQLRAVYVAEDASVGHLLGWGNGWGWWTNERVSSGTLGNSRSFNLDKGSVDLVSNNFKLNCFGIRR